jgi:cytoskeleton protein RodZ
MREGSAAEGVPSSPLEGRTAAGAALLKERRRQGLSLGDISRQLKLSVRQVEALERDDYSAYKGPVFIHGFIRNYAKLLGLEPEPLIRATDSMLNPSQIAAPSAHLQERARPEPAVRGKRPLWPVITTLLLIAIALSFYFGGHRSPEGGRSAPSVAARDKGVSSAKSPSAEVKSRVESKPDTEPVPKSVTKPVAKAETKPDSRTRNETAVRSAAEPIPAIAADAAGQVKVRMIFEQESWVEIKDRSGNTIFGQLNPAGSRRSVSGEPPLSVVVGHSAGVQLFVGDKNVDLAPHTRVDVARLTLE